MASESTTTTSHQRIKEWVTQRGGHPAMVKDTGTKNDPGVLRIDFPGYSGKDSLSSIDWDTFFTKFDESHLAFLYQETTADGKPSRFCKFVRRDEARH